MLNTNDKKHGFTLIELLIVIVIIGILAGVLIAIIDPQKQQNMATDATITSMVNKVILSTSSFVSSYGRYPNGNEFFASLKANVNELGNNCTAGGDDECIFNVNGISLPSTCDANGWEGTDLQQCYFRYQGGINGENARYRIYVKSVGIKGTLFVYDNLEGGEIFECPDDISDADSLMANCH